MAQRQRSRWRTI
ncbi:hypothetical protein D039_2795A, partial [Vibrio parahaemolyticus EKP-028]